MVKTRTYVFEQPPSAHVAAQAAAQVDMADESGETYTQTPTQPPQNTPVGANGDALIVLMMQQQQQLTTLMQNMHMPTQPPALNGKSIAMKVPIFSGRGENVVNWVADIKEYFNISNIPKHKWAISIAGTLEGAAKRFYRTLSHQVTGDLEQTLAALENHFQKDTKKHYLKRLNIMQTSTQSVEEFADDMEVRLADANILDEDTKVIHFVDKLRPDLNREVLKLNSQTLEEAIQNAKNVEESILKYGTDNVQIASVVGMTMKNMAAELAAAKQKTEELEEKLTALNSRDYSHQQNSRQQQQRTHPAPQRPRYHNNAPRQQSYNYRRNEQQPTYHNQGQAHYPADGVYKRLSHFKGECYRCGKQGHMARDCYTHLN